MWLTDLHGKVVLVTGASAGIGAAAARAFGSAGCRVAVHGHSRIEAAHAVAAEVVGAGGDAVVVAGDVALRGGPEAVVAMAMNALGPIDVLVNNAGGLLRRAALADCHDDYVDGMLALNARQIVAFTRAVVPGMRQRGGGSIVNVGSSAARHGGGNGTAVYSATKGFVASLTRALAKELAADGIRVNAVSPGVILTSFHDRHTSASALEASRANIPLKRLGRADECAGAMLFLASNTMSSFVTGQVLEVNGGQVMP